MRIKAIFMALVFVVALSSSLYAAIKPAPEPTPPGATVASGTIPGGTIPDEPAEVTPTDTPESGEPATVTPISTLVPTAPGGIKYYFPIIGK